jgi:Chemotaxis response regulator containing a CheY-like receiver domain and a methylesterase domain
MPLRVLIVDDSNFFQLRLKDIIGQHPELQVVGIASNGREAVEKAAELRPDIITMDFEMPVMDGVTAVKHIMAQRPVPILMFSSLTYEGARITLDALAAGAMDFMPKDFAEVSRNSSALKEKLHERLLTLGRSGYRSGAAASLPVRTQTPRPAPAAPVATPKPAAPAPKTSTATTDNYTLKKKPKLLVIGASTGGPVALNEVLTALPSNFPLPILLVQHMPENFTKAFAERLNRQCKIQVREAVDGDVLRPGLALLAPGGKQMMLDKRNSMSVRILPDDDRVNYKPSLDITFGSAANTFGDRVLGIVLTGMGADGCNGARMLKQAGSSIWSQDEASCVIYGMPAAVAKAQLTDKVLSLKDIGPRLVREVM